MPETTRTFVAIPLPQALVAKLERLQSLLAQSLAGVRWARGSTMHLTVAFLGEVDNSRLNEICRAVATALADFEPFALCVEGVGVFPNTRRPTTIWAGLAAQRIDARPPAAGSSAGAMGEEEAAQGPGAGEPEPPLLIPPTRSGDAPRHPSNAKGSRNEEALVREESTADRLAPLFALQKAVADAFRRLGFPPEDRFHPHITLGRIKVGRTELPDLARLLERHRKWQAGILPVSEVCTYASSSSPDGPVYAVLSTAVLRRGKTQNDDLTRVRKRR